MADLVAQAQRVPNSLARELEAGARDPAAETAFAAKIACMYVPRQTH